EDPDRRQACPLLIGLAGERVAVMAEVAQQRFVAFGAGELIVQLASARSRGSTSRSRPASTW
ncbi:MAG: hypothetical protein LC777_10260, partial [Actinobacteria bacterium]|nr:hypothetical protein [Actinomycetota bacterium]